jgi:hypothetical protein
MTPTDPHEHYPVVTVRDTLTGKTAVEDRFNRWWWTDGNGACDCNRELLFDAERDDSGVCLGCRRYVVVEVDGGPPDDRFNEGYPVELLSGTLRKDEVEDA